MKSFGQITMIVIGGVAISGTVWAADDAAAPANTLPPDNPYSQIVVRNVFNLVPPPPPEVAAPEAPTKITLTGIQNFFGKAQALFKVAGVAKPGQPPQDKYYMLMEGQRQDDIEVKHIDEKNKIVTFDNHGTDQELPLTTASASSGGGGGPSPLPGGNPGLTPTGNPGGEGFQGRGFGRFGPRGGFQGRGVNNPAAANPSPDSLNLRTVPTRPPSTSSQDQQQMTPEQHVIMMEVNRAMTQEQVNQGTMPPLPVTPITPEDATGQGGSPLK